MQTPSWYVITGGPSAGKSTLIKELAKRDYLVIHEIARTVIERELARGREFADVRADAAGFQQGVLREKIAVEKELPQDQIVFLDRGIPDSVAYYRKEGVPEDVELWDAMEPKMYKKVFILDLIGEGNFKQDGARSEDWQDAVVIDQLLEKAYIDLGYELIRVPVMSLSERVEYILSRI